MPTTTHDGIVLDYQVTGEGPPLLIISGLSAQRPFWGNLRPLLTGFTLVEFDNRDIGKSSMASGPYTAADMAGDALAVLDAAGIAKAHVLGHSVEWVFAEALASFAIGEHLLRRVDLYDFVKVALDAGLTQPKDGFLRQLAVCETANTADRLHKVAAPTLVLYSDADRFFSSAMAREIASAIPVGADLDEIVDSGHCPMVEQPQAFAQVVTRFLKPAPR